MADNPFGAAAAKYSSTPPSGTITPGGNPFAKASASMTTPSATPDTTIVPANQSSGGGGGGFLGAIDKLPGVSTIEHGAHVVEGGIQSGLNTAASTALSVGTGTYNYLKAAILPKDVGWGQLGHEWSTFIQHPLREAKQEQKTDPFVNQTIQSVAPLAHPERNPWQTALAVGFIVLPFAASAGVRAAYIGSVARAARVTETGDLVAIGSKAADAAESQGLTLTPLTAGEKAGLTAKALNPGYKPPLPARVLHVPTNRVDSEGNITEGSVATQLPTSESPLIRGGQAIIDKGLQRGLDRQSGLLTKIAHSRIAGTADELNRITLETRQALETGLQRAGRQGSHVFDKGINKKLGNLAVLLRSAQGAPEDAIALWSQGEPTAAKAFWSKQAQQLVDKGVLTRGSDGKLVIDAGKFPKLAAADKIVQQAQAEGENIISQHDLMSKEGQQARLDLVGRVLAGGRWGEGPTSRVTTAPLDFKTVESAHGPYKVHTAVGENVRKIGTNTIYKLQHVDEKSGNATVFHGKYGTKTIKASELEIPGKFGIQGGLSGVGQGEGYTSLKIAQKPPPRTAVAAARTLGAKIGKAKKPEGFAGPQATGEGFLQAQIPWDTIGGVTQHLAALNRYQNTVAFRENVWHIAHDVRQTLGEILIRDPNGKGNPEIPLDINKDLGLIHDLTAKEAQEGTDLGLQAAIEDRLAQDFPSREGGDPEHQQLEKSAPVGTKAPDGYRWISKDMVPASVRTVQVSRSGLEKGIDNLNTAITAATVYLRLGHIPTRTLTNATTNIIQGSANPFEIAKSWRMAKLLTNQEKLDLVGTQGPGGFRGVLPEEVQQASAIGRGVSIAGQRFHRAVGGAANWWHVHVDSEFRLNSVLYELRKAGIDTPEQIRDVIDFAKDPASVTKNAAWVSKAQHALIRSRRASIMYDGLNSFERRYIARVIWFYPWTKGATRFALHTAAEHPVKSYAIAQAGIQGAQERQNSLGGVPNYEFGLTPLTGGQNPLTSNFSSYTPFGTLGDVANMSRHPLSSEGVFGQLNPALAGAYELTQGKNLLGAAGQAFGPTPESRIVNAISGATGKTFGTTPLGIHDPHTAAIVASILRELGGAGVPRPTNKAQLNQQAARQKEKKRTITVFG